MSSKKATLIFCAIALALGASCAPEIASIENAKLKLSQTSSAANFSRAISNVERGYSGIGQMSLNEIEAVAGLDQEARRLFDLVKASDLFAREKLPLKGRISLVMYKNDDLRSSELLAIKPLGRWFNATELSPSGQKAAWLIVQHGDPEIQEKVLPELLIASKQGLVASSDVAMLADRVEVGAGRPQIYGTQLSCIGSEPVFPDLLDPGNVDKRREEVGLKGTFEAYKIGLLATNPC